jgi:hypothetical protein
MVGPWIRELARAFEDAARLDGAITVDVSDVSFVAAPGVSVLRDLIGRGATLRGCPAYLVSQLDGSEA